MRRRVAAAAGLAGLLVAIVACVVLVQKVPNRTGSNASTSVSGVAVTIPASRQRCQREPTSIPAGTQQITVFGARRPGAGPLRIRARSGGRTVARAVIEDFPAERPYTVALRPRATREIPRVRICFDNDGPRNVALAGNRTPPVGPGNPNQKYPQEDVRTDFSRAGDSSRIALAGDVARRLPLQKSAVLGDWTLWAVLVVVLGLMAAGTRLVIREADE